MAPALGIPCPPLLSITQICFCPLLTVLAQLPSGFTKSLTESWYPRQRNPQERKEHGKQGAIEDYWHVLRPALLLLLLFSRSATSDFFVTPWTIAHQASLSMGFPLGKNTGVGCHFLLQEILPTQGSNLRSPAFGEQTVYH